MISLNRKLTFFTLVVLAGLVAVAIGAGPAWWATSGAVDGNLQENEYSAVNQGQLKHFTTKAVAELNAASPPDGAGPTLNALVQSWTTAHPDEKDYETVTIGQLKYIGALIYDRLGLAYPWSATTTDDNDEATANIGQLKQVFNVDVSGISVDGDDLPDGWEITHGFDPNNSDENNNGVDDGLDDADGDGVSNYQEYLDGTDPRDPGDAINPPAPVVDISNQTNLRIWTPLMQ